MGAFAVLTPSYAPDADLCRELNRSVLDLTDAEHHIIVPRSDRGLFRALDGERTHVRDVEELVPRGMLPVPGANVWVNRRRPFPPVRGWVMQQLVKLAAVVELDADVVLLADSDVTLVRPVTLDTLRIDGQARLYRDEGGVTERMPRHVRWHHVARRLLGLPPAGPPPLPDYICPLNVWDRRVVLALRDRIERVTGRPWLDAVAAQVHVSEFILYGVFVDELHPGRAATSGLSLCHTYWGPGPLRPGDAPAFAGSIDSSDVAVMVSAKTNTPSSVRCEVLTRVV